MRCCSRQATKSQQECATLRKDRLLEFDLKPHRKSMSRRSLIHNVADNSITGATEYVCVNGYVCVNAHPAGDGGPKHPKSSREAPVWESPARQCREADPELSASPVGAIPCAFYGNGAPANSSCRAAMEFTLGFTSATTRCSTSTNLSTSSCVLNRPKLTRINPRALSPS